MPIRFGDFFCPFTLNIFEDVVHLRQEMPVLSVEK